MGSTIVFFGCCFFCPKNVDVFVFFCFWFFSPKNVDVFVCLLVFVLSIFLYIFLKIFYFNVLFKFVK